MNRVPPAPETAYPRCQNTGKPDRHQPAFWRMRLHPGRGLHPRYKDGIVAAYGIATTTEPLP